MCIVARVLFVHGFIWVIFSIGIHYLYCFFVDVWFIFAWTSYAPVRSSTNKIAGAYGVLMRERVVHVFSTRNRWRIRRHSENYAVQELLSQLMRHGWRISVFHLAHKAL